jgi:hypothetical protein
VTSSEATPTNSSIEARNTIARLERKTGVKRRLSLVRHVLALFARQQASKNLSRSGNLPRVKKDPRPFLR